MNLVLREVATPEETNRTGKFGSFGPIMRSLCINVSDAMSEGYLQAEAIWSRDDLSRALSARQWLSGTWFPAH